MRAVRDNYRSAESNYAQEATVRKAADYNAEDHLNEEGKCAYSQQATDGNAPSCKVTEVLVKSSQVVNVGGQLAGGIAVQVAGAEETRKAAKEGTQSAALNAAAETAKVGAEKELSLGGANVALGALQLVQALRHSGSKDDFTQAKKDAQKTGADGSYDVEPDGTVKAKAGKSQNLLNTTITNFNVNNVAEGGDFSAGADPAKKREAEDKKRKLVGAQTSRILAKASGEQNAASDEAVAGGMASMISGAQQLTSGGFALASANKMKKAARELQNAENTANNLPVFDSSNFQADPLAPRQGVAITGNGIGGAESAAAEDSETKDALPNLGPPINTGNDKGDLTGPPVAPGAFQAGNGSNPAGAGGGGLGGLGGGGTSPEAAAATEGDQNPRLADNGGKIAYGGGGGAYVAGGGSGGGGDKGPDLSGLLDKFLPKKEDADKNPNGILAFGEGGRGPANDDTPLLGKNANIFQRISETYADKNRRGAVGI